MEGRYLQHSGQNSPTLLCLDTSIKRLLFGGLRSFCGWKTLQSMTSTPLIQKYTFVILQILCLWEETSQLYLHIPRSLSVQVGWSYRNNCYKAVWYKGNTLPDWSKMYVHAQLNACCPELMVLLWPGGVRRLTQAATFTDGLFRDCFHKLDSTTGKVILAVVLYLKSLSKHTVAHSWPGGNDLCPLLTQLAVLRGLKPGRKQWAACPFYALNMRSWALGTGHRAHTTDALKITPTAALWMLQWPRGSGDHCELPARGWQEAGIAHPSAPLLFHP